MTRDPSSGDDLKKLGAEVVRGDLCDPASIRAACDGAERVIASAHSLTGRGRNGPDRVDRLGHQTLIDAAVAAGVRHFIYISAYNIGPDHPVDFFRIKYETERYLESSGLRYTILRATGFMETSLQFVGEMLRKGRVVFFGDGNNPVNFVSVEDVAQYVVNSLENKEMWNRTIDIGGPENLSMNQFVDICEKVSGNSARRTYLPLPLMRTISYLVRPFSPLVTRILRMGILSSTEDMTFDTERTEVLFSIERTRLKDVTRKHLAAGTGPGA